jgi:hypothetical protein
MTWPCQASEHDADHGEPDEGGDGARISLEITRQAAMAANPGQGSFDDPALGQDDELVQLVALDDLKHPTAGAGSGCAWSLIAGIGEDPRGPRVSPILRGDFHRERSACGKTARYRRARPKRKPGSCDQRQDAPWYRASGPHRSRLPRWFCLGRRLVAETGRRHAS